MSKNPLTAFALLISAFVAAIVSSASDIDDKKIVGDLDTQYQLAVKNNDAKAMDRILADDCVLVMGRGQTFTKADLLKETRGNTVYEHQEDTNQVVHVWGDTAVVNALLWAKGTEEGQGVRLQAMVQRHLRPYPDRLAVCVRTGIATASRALDDHARRLPVRQRRAGRQRGAGGVVLTATAELASAARIPALVELMAEFYAASGYPLDRLWATNSFSVLLNDPSLGSAWLLLDDGETAGYAVLTVRFIMEHGGCNAFVDDLFVRSRHRRRGVGRDAMTALIGECKRRSVRCTLKSDPIMHRPTRFTAASALCRAATVASC